MTYGPFAAAAPPRMAGACPEVTSPSTPRRAPSLIVSMTPVPDPGRTKTRNRVWRIQPLNAAIYRHDHRHRRRARRARAQPSKSQQRQSPPPRRGLLNDAHSPGGLCLPLITPQSLDSPRAPSLPLRAKRSSLAGARARRRDCSNGTNAEAPGIESATAGTLLRSFRSSSVSLARSSRRDCCLTPGAAARAVLLLRSLTGNLMASVDRLPTPRTVFTARLPETGLSRQRAATATAYPMSRKGFSPGRRRPDSRIPGSDSRAL
jgi:hypothetical protein